jgi:hypothetical protein
MSAFSIRQNAWEDAGMMRTRTTPVTVNLTSLKTLNLSQMRVKV